MLSLLFLLLPLFSLGQSSTTQPAIIYSYDAAGNRIQRKKIEISLVASPIEKPKEPAVLDPNGPLLVRADGPDAMPAQADFRDPSGFQNPKDCENAATPQLSVYPNPSTGVFNLAFSGAPLENPVIQLYDGNGQLVSTRGVSETPRVETIDLSHLPAGSYHLTVSAGEWYGRAVLVRQ